jgi:hypothetical protein
MSLKQQIHTECGGSIVLSKIENNYFLVCDECEKKWKLSVGKNCFGEWRDIRKEEIRVRFGE